MGEGWRGAFSLVVLMSLEKKPNLGEGVNFWLHLIRKCEKTEREKDRQTERERERKRERKK